MKKIEYIVVALFIIWSTFCFVAIGCDADTNYFEIKKNTGTVYRSTYETIFSVDTIVVDNCEYIVLTGENHHSGMSIIHKANCTNCKNKELP